MNGRGVVLKVLWCRSRNTIHENTRTLTNTTPFVTVRVTSWIVLSS
jgi:hypothetical protein